MNTEDINAVIEQFAKASQMAICAGFDGVEIHGKITRLASSFMQTLTLKSTGGNGYLLDTFVHDNINNRIDEYGGSLENRLRFPLSVVDAVVAAIGSEKTAIRLAPFHVLQQTLDSDRIATFIRYTEELEKKRLAYIHMMEPRYDQLSTEGAFSGKIDRVVGAGGDCTACDVKGEVRQPETERIFSLWTFRDILKQTPLIGAGGYDAKSARVAITESRLQINSLG